MTLVLHKGGIHAFIGDVEYKFYLFFVLFFESKLWGELSPKNKKVKIKYKYI